MIIMHSAGGVIVNSKKEVVIVAQGRGRELTWSLPKGRIEAGEDALTAAKREIYEESGLTEFEYVKEYPEYQRRSIGADGKEAPFVKVMHFFKFTSNQEKLMPVDPDNPTARWVTPQEAAELLSNPRDKEFFQSIMGEL